MLLKRSGHRMREAGKASLLVAVKGGGGGRKREGMSAVVFSSWLLGSPIGAQTLRPTDDTITAMGVLNHPTRSVLARRQVGLSISIPPPR